MLLTGPSTAVSSSSSLQTGPASLANGVQSNGVEQERRDHKQCKCSLRSVLPFLFCWYVIRQGGGKTGASGTK